MNEDITGSAAAVDHTTTWDKDGAGGDQTGVVAPITEAGPTLEDLAWSEAADYDAETERRSWLNACGRAAAVLVVGLAIAGTIVLGREVWIAHEHSSGQMRPTPHAESSASPSPVAAVPIAPAPSPIAAPPTTTVTVQVPAPTTTVEAAPSVEPPVLVTPAAPSSIPDPDESYLAALRAAGLTVTDPALAISGGRGVCIYLRQGHSETEAEELGIRNNPSLSAMGAVSAVKAAVTAYCPEQRPHGGEY